MAYMKSSLYQMIRDDLKRMEGQRETVKAGFMEKRMPKSVPISKLHVNPDDEFTFPNIGPNDSIVENYSQIARRNREMNLNVYPEPIIVNRLKMGDYLILNGHHRWAGAVKAGVPKVRILVTDPDKVN